MFNTLITYGELFGIGFSFNFIGPCLMFCLPIITAYSLDNKNSRFSSMLDIILFFSGRLFAYVLLGFIAGISGLIFKKYLSSVYISYAKIFAGIFIIIVGLFFLHKQKCANSDCKKHDVISRLGLFSVGFLLGITPCAPLVSLLLNIMLMSKAVLESMMYAFCFGVGTFASGILIVLIIKGAIKIIPKNLFSQELIFVFRILCSIFMIFVGVQLIINAM
jgi:sulfite exporter TauE/SafE